MTPPPVEVRSVPLASIVAAPYNPRVTLTPDTETYQTLARSMERWGQVEPLVWNQRTGHLVGGHQRLAVLRDAGHTTVEVTVVDLDLPREQALNLALNNIEGAWDMARLVEILSGLDAEGFDATLTGFSMAELESILTGWEGPPGGAPDPDQYDPEADLFLVRVEKVPEQVALPLLVAIQSAMDAEGLPYQATTTAAEGS